jgi:DNA-binding NarL/FixJ family response regulator
MAGTQRRRAEAPPPERIRVLVADDHEVVRRGLKQLLAETPDIVVTGEAGDARGVLGHVRTQP